MKLCDEEDPCISSSFLDEKEQLAWAWTAPGVENSNFQVTEPGWKKYLQTPAHVPMSISGEEMHGDLGQSISQTV